MTHALAGLAQPLLAALPPEDAHELALRALELGLHPRQSTPDPDVLAQTVFGLDFPNPVGVAAGFDKDARVPDALLAIGCGFAEVGTLTPKPQSGNPKPRVFRLKEDRAIINRLGFNNGGHEAARRRLEKRAGRGGIVGVNIGANRDSADRAGDYAAGVARFQALASYFTVNVSSPNTPGLRDLQAPDALATLVDGVMAARQAGVDAGKPAPPVVVKLAPDIAEADLPAILDVLVARRVDGIAVSNTTLARPGLSGRAAKEAGGLSGAPLFHRSTAFLARVFQATGGEIPLIGIGGIDAGAQAVEKIRAGASLIQLYTGLVYAGPGLIGEIKSAIAEAATAAGGLGALRGQSAGAWAAKPLEG